MNEDKKLKIPLIILTLITGALASFIVYASIVDYNQHKNCYYETYIQNPCQGATHYARLHRIRDEGCERQRRVCPTD